MYICIVDKYFGYDTSEVSQTPGKISDRMKNKKINQ